MVEARAGSLKPGVQVLTETRKWTIVGLLSASITINLLHRQVLSVLASELRSQFHWTNAQYGYIAVAFNLERLNHLEFADATEPATDQGTKDILVTDMKHPVFAHFWRPAHIIGYEHTFIAALGEFLESLEKDTAFHPDFSDGLAVQRILAALQQSARSGQWVDITNRGPNHG